MTLKLETEKHVLEIKDLHASVDGKKVLNGVSLTVQSGEIHALMGPNGSGKSTLSYVIMGHPRYAVEKGDVLLDGQSILGLSPDERAKRGLFLAFQYPLDVPGVSMANFLRTAYNEGRLRQQQIGVFAFQKILQEHMERLKIPISFGDRYVNDGFSGGEKKRCEILQMAILQPHLAVMDETDSGLDVDALHIVAHGTTELVNHTNLGVLLITHYPRILHYLKPTKVHIFVNGKIQKSGGTELADQLERTGYGALEPVQA